MKLFVSQPMRGYTLEEIKEERKNIVERLISDYNFDRESLEVIDNFFEDAPENTKAMWYLGGSIRLMSEADVVYFPKDYYKTRGCRIEFEIAKHYGVPRIIID